MFAFRKVPQEPLFCDAAGVESILKGCPSIDSIYMQVLLMRFACFTTSCIVL
jgi:hypothetical protein